MKAHLLDKAGAAEHLGTTVRHITELWRTRQLTGVRVGGKVRFRPEDLDSYIESNLTEKVR